MCTLYQWKEKRIAFNAILFAVFNIIKIDALEDKQLFAPSEEDEFLLYIKELGNVIGCYESESNELIAMGVYGKLGHRENNYGYDLEMAKEELLSVGQIESTVVSPEYRGNSLQKKICLELERISKNNNDKLLCATVSPYNKYSLKIVKINKMNRNNMKKFEYFTSLVLQDLNR